MAVTQSQEGILLQGDCNIDTAETLRELLLSLIAAGNQQIMVITEAMTSVDVSVLQVFLAARISLQECGGRLTIQPSPLVTRLLQDAGISDSTLFPPSAIH